MELLNGKAKELFDEWRMTDKSLETYGTVYFYDLPKELQCTMIIEWLDSVGYYVSVKKVIAEYWMYDILGHHISVFEPMQLNRQQATTEAIKKAVELINESNGK